MVLACSRSGWLAVWRLVSRRQQLSPLQPTGADAVFSAIKQQQAYLGSRHGNGAWLEAEAVLAYSSCRSSGC